uniref:HECT domain-containing protein n=1 Tax=Macrostomum lignano TaxID=282301 RepID=A0A1I8JP13_9PLAT
CREKVRQLPELVPVSPDGKPQLDCNGGSARALLRDFNSDDADSWGSASLQAESAWCPQRWFRTACCPWMMKLLSLLRHLAGYSQIVLLELTLDGKVFNGSLGQAFARLSCCVQSAGPTAWLPPPANSASASASGGGDSTAEDCRRTMTTNWQLPLARLTPPRLPRPVADRLRRLLDAIRPLLLAAAAFADCRAFTLLDATAPAAAAASSDDDNDNDGDFCLPAESLCLWPWLTWSSDWTVAASRMAANWVSTDLSWPNLESLAHSIACLLLRLASPPARLLLRLAWARLRLSAACRRGLDDQGRRSATWRAGRGLAAGLSPNSPDWPVVNLAALRRLRRAAKSGREFALASAAARSGNSAAVANLRDDFVSSCYRALRRPRPVLFRTAPACSRLLAQPTESRPVRASTVAFAFRQICWPAGGIWAPRPADLARDLRSAGCVRRSHCPVPAPSSAAHRSAEAWIYLHGTLCFLIEETEKQINDKSMDTLWPRLWKLILMHAAEKPVLEAGTGQGAELELVKQRKLELVKHRKRWNWSTASEAGTGQGSSWELKAGTGQHQHRKHRKQQQVGWNCQHIGKLEAVNDIGKLGTRRTASCPSWKLEPCHDIGSWNCQRQNAEAGSVTHADADRWSNAFRQLDRKFKCRLEAEVWMKSFYEKKSATLASCRQQSAGNLRWNLRAAVDCLAHPADAHEYVGARRGGAAVPKSAACLQCRLSAEAIVPATAAATPWLVWVPLLLRATACHRTTTGATPGRFDPGLPLPSTAAWQAGAASYAGAAAGSGIIDAADRRLAYSTWETGRHLMRVLSAGQIPEFDSTRLASAARPIWQRCFDIGPRRWPARITAAHGPGPVQPTPTERLNLQDGSNSSTAASAANHPELRDAGEECENWAVQLHAGQVLREVGRSSRYLPWLLRRAANELRDRAAPAIPNESATSYVLPFNVATLFGGGGGGGGGAKDRSVDMPAAAAAAEPGELIVLKITRLAEVDSRAEVRQLLNDQLDVVSAVHSLLADLLARLPHHYKAACLLARLRLRVGKRREARDLLLGRRPRSRLAAAGSYALSGTVPGPPPGQSVQRRLASAKRRHRQVRLLRARHMRRALELAIERRRPIARLLPLHTCLRKHTREPRLPC